MVDLSFKIVLPILMIGSVTVAAHRLDPAVRAVLCAVPSKVGPISSEGGPILLPAERGNDLAAQLPMQEAAH
jgi:hypothetical protein